MTPENTPRMAERTDRQAQIDPWDSVHQEFADMSQWETTRVYRADAVDAARAADAALLRERDAQIASLTAQVERWRSWAQFVYLAGGPVTLDDQALRDAVCATHDADTATLRAERDAAQQEIAKRDASIALMDDLRQSNSALQAGLTAEQQRSRTCEQENTTLREALQTQSALLLKERAERGVTP